MNHASTLKSIASKCERGLCEVSDITPAGRAARRWLEIIGKQAHDALKRAERIARGA